jgi:hypothetical protein
LLTILEVMRNRLRTHLPVLRLIQKLVPNNPSVEVTFETSNYFISLQNI